MLWIKTLVNWIASWFNWVLCGVCAFLHSLACLVEAAILFVLNLAMQIVMLLWSYKYFIAALGLWGLFRFYGPARHYLKISLQYIGGWIFKLFGIELREEQVFLASGRHEIRIELDKAPLKVWISLEDNEGVPVCHGNVDKVGVETGENFIVLYADIFSSSRTIRWFAILN